MATKATRKTTTRGTRRPRRKPAPRGAPRRNTDLVILLYVAVSLLALLSLALPGSSGLVGSQLARALRWLVGAGAWVFPAALMAVAAAHATEHKVQPTRDIQAGVGLLFVAFLGWRHVVGVAPGDEATAEVWRAHGGVLGAGVGSLMRSVFGEVGGLVVLGCLAVLGVVLVTDVPVFRLLQRVFARSGRGVLRAGVVVGDAAARKRESLKEARRLRSLEPREKPEPRPRLKRSSSLSWPPRLRLPGEPEEEAEATRPYSAPVVRDYTLQQAEAAVEEPSRPPKPRKKAQPAPAATPVAAGDDPEPPFQLPPLSILKPSPPPAKQSQAEREENVRVLEETLATFKIDARVVEICRGPTVTRYEIQLAPGIKVQKIVSLADNLAMSLAAIDVRVEAPIPGKSAIGVEVPNRTPTPVMLRQVVESPEFMEAPSKLTVVLGLDVAGQPRVADLARMPHLLVGGSTNSGKSVCLNSLIASLLLRATPDEVKLLLIDPKRVELSLYDHIPHLVYPVVKDVKQAAGVLRWALKEMDRRYDLFVEQGARNIDSYNRKIEALRESGGEEARRLPYLVIIVDELADLMMQMGPEVETSICRLAQLARATGIHLVIATQRPSVDVITGTIKANISSRIAFAVASHTDSRTILNTNGAERLVGRGDMLFLPIDATKPTRIQGAYIGEAEIEALVDHLKAQAKPDYEAEVVTVDSSAMKGVGGSGADTETDDALFEQAVRLVVTTGHASTSMLQRKFKIGYTRAARLVDIMEEHGIVGPMDAAKPREVLMPKESLNSFFTNRYGRDPAGEDEDDLE